jgi:hypothetical protein
MRIKRHSLENPKYFLVGFTSVSAFGCTKNLIGYDNFINFHWLPQYVGNFRRTNQIIRLLKCGCHASKLPLCKQRHGSGLPLTTNSVIIDLTIVDLLRKELQYGECAHSRGLRVVTRRPFFLSLDLYRQQPADRRNNMRRKKKRGDVLAPHAAERETSWRQLPYHPVQAQIYVMVFSTSTRAMDINCFRNTFKYWF